MNKSLHIMIAHVHRYRSEISRLEDVLTELSSRYEKYFSFVDSKDDVDESVNRTSNLKQVKLSYQQLMSHLRSVRSFHEESERESQSILALVC